MRASDPPRLTAGSRERAAPLTQPHVAPSSNRPGNEADQSGSTKAWVSDPRESQRPVADRHRRRHRHAGRACAGRCRRPSTRDARPAPPTPRAHRGLWWAVGVPQSGHGPAREPRRDARRASQLHIVPPAPGPRRLCRTAAAAGIRAKPEPGSDRWRSVVQPGGHGVLVSWVLEGPHLVAGSGRRAPQPAVRHVRAGDGHRDWALRRGADQRSGPDRPGTDHRSFAGGSGPARHAARRRGAGSARAGWVGRRGLSIPAGVVGLD